VGLVLGHFKHPDHQRDHHYSTAKPDQTPEYTGDKTD
jgi:hypothetical protein